MKATVLSGLDRIETADTLLRGRRVGLMTNPTGLSSDFRGTIDIVRERYNLTALFACEHGIRGDIQAGVEIDEHIDAETGVRVYSTYNTSHRMLPEMTEAFDVFLFDMQDVGVRFYTYLYSLAYAMEECAKAGKPVVVLDRLNPVGGERVEGTILDRRFASFVGDYEIPTRQGITVGEFARYVRAYLKLDLELHVVPLSGWRRSLYLDDTNTPWVAPSPNCPTLHAALCYIGTCIFEGTNISEGRGTTLPFELIGAPWVDAAALEKAMNAHQVPGLHFRRTSFVPMFSKHAGQVCYGVQVHVTDRSVAEAFAGGILLMDEIRAQDPEKVTFITWNDGDEKYGLDRLLGTNAYRLGHVNARELIAKHAPGVRAFAEASKAYYLYD